MRINEREISRNQEPFIIMEMSGNHNHSLERVLKIVEAVAEAGADAIKLQTYTEETMTLDIDKDDYNITDDENLWKGKNLFDLYKGTYTPWEWYEPIFNRAKELGIIAFCSPLDAMSVDFLETLDVPMCEIASFDNNDVPLIKKFASTGKPTIMSIGMATAAQLDEVVRAARESGCKELVLLKCTSAYPATPENSNLLTIPHIRELFGAEVGLYNHTMGVGVSVASVALGAAVIEKHFTLSWADCGVDSAFSMKPTELKALVEETERAWLAMDGVLYGPTEAEKASLRFRKSIYAAKDIQAGKSFKEDIRVIRPGDGLEPKYLKTVLQLKAPKNITAGTPLSRELLTQ